MRYLLKSMRLLTAAIAVFSMQQGFGQSVDQYVFASAGGTSVLATASTLTFTAGEPIITTAGNNPILSQGFNQPSIDPVPLPVQMTFSGKTESGANLLSWETYKEERNSYFSLERSVDGVKFAPIAKVLTKAPGGNSINMISYWYADKAYTNGLNYYRLKQVDMDGRSVYSAIVKLNNTTTSVAFSVSPNPATDMIQIAAPESGVISVIDMNGKVLLTKNIQSADQLNVSNMASGAYFVNFKGITTTASLRFVKE